MKVLVVNCGSSTLKFALYEMGMSQPSLSDKAQRLAHGTVDRIGELGSIDFSDAKGREVREAWAAADHAEASRKVLDWLGSGGLMGDGPGAVGHRVIHGGDAFVEPVIIDNKVVAAIDRLSGLAPLHNRPSLEAIRAVREILGPEVPMVAVFDTAFHRTLPERAHNYAIPPELANKHHIRRYGFHGLAHRYMAERYASITGKSLAQAKLITLQLGNGCSATAIENGQSVDTSMGFTPLEGLVMGTRSGDVDPTLAGFLAQREGVTVETAEDWLNTRSGLLGISGRSKNMRDLLDAELKGDRMAALAIDMFCYRVKKYIGSYLAVLNSADAVIFGGGIGENAAEVRARICAGMEWCGLELDEGRNRAAVASEGRISTDGARIETYVVPVNEALVIARDTVSCVQNWRRSGA